MKIISEVYNYNDFNFWSGAADNVKYLNADEIESVVNQLEEIYPEGMTDIEFNDFFWFEVDTIAEMLGYNDFEEIRYREDG